MSMRRWFQENKYKRHPAKGQLENHPVANEISSTPVPSPILSVGASHVAEERSKPVEPSESSAELPIRSAAKTFPGSEKPIKPATKSAPRAGLIELNGFHETLGRKTKVDIVAIHGLDGDPLKSWDEDGVIWFSDLLPKELSEFDFRIFTFGYNSRILFGGSAFQTRDFATDLLSNLQLKREKTGTNNVPIVFICHSLGGIVYKKMLIIAHERQSMYNSIKSSTKGVIVFGTPHGGSDFVKLSRVLRNIVDICTFGSARVDLLKNLERRSAELEEVAEQFVERATHLKVVSVYEGRPPASAPASFPVVVDKSSALLGLANERVIPVDADHEKICKFSSAEDPRYQHVLFAVATLIKDIVALEDNELKVCIDMLHFRSYNERRTNVLDARADTFAWVWDQPKYKFWENQRSSSLLWLQGKPGSGKSTLANYVRARVRDRMDRRFYHHSIVVDFFYSARGGNVQNGHYWMLRSILYQFLLKAPGLWPCYINDFRDSRQREQSNEWPHRAQFDNDTATLTEHLWTMDRLELLFSSLGSIHAPELQFTAYVIIDALDEAEEVGRQQMVQRFLNASLRDPSWPITFKVFLTSRPSPKIEQILRGRHTIILEDETSNDIAGYVNSEIKRIATDILLCDYQDLDYVSSYIIGWAQGVSLWVRLVLIELDDKATMGLCSVAELEALLISIPTDLRQLYARIMEKVQTGLRSSIRECQTILRWEAFSPRPLLVDELLEVVAASACTGPGLSSAELKRRRVGNVTDMRRRLISLCGNLVEIKRNVVQFIHTSVREYLLEEAHSDAVSLRCSDSLLEIASLCADYVEYFQARVENDCPLSAIKETMSAEDIQLHIQLVKQSLLIGHIFGYDKVFLQSLERELEELPRPRSLTKSMTSASKTLQPVVLETVLQGDQEALDTLILYADQTNTLYSLPRDEPRLDLTMLDAMNFHEDRCDATLLQTVSTSKTKSKLDILALVLKRGADPNIQDCSGQTSLHTAVQAGSKAYTIALGLVEKGTEPTIQDCLATRTSTMDEWYDPESSNDPDPLFRLIVQSKGPRTALLRFALESGVSELRAAGRSEIETSTLISFLLRSEAVSIADISAGGKTTIKALMPPAIRPNGEPGTFWALSRMLSSYHAQTSRLIMYSINLPIDLDRLLQFCVDSEKKSLEPAFHSVLECRALVRSLLRGGADPMIQDNVSSNTPLELALQSGDREIAFMLLDSTRTRLEFKLSLIRSKSERRHTLEQTGFLLAKYLYQQCEKGLDVLIPYPGKWAVDFLASNTKTPPYN